MHKLRLNFEPNANDDAGKTQSSRSCKRVGGRRHGRTAVGVELDQVCECDHEHIASVLHPGAKTLTLQNRSTVARQSKHSSSSSNMLENDWQNAARSGQTQLSWLTSLMVELSTDEKLATGCPSNQTRCAERRHRKRNMDGEAATNGGSETQ